MHDLLIAGSDRCYRQPTNSSWSESTVERTLSSLSAILMNDPALCCLVERRRNPGKLRSRLIEFPRGDRLANLLLARFERTGDAGVACAASDALARAFGCGFDVCHEVNSRLSVRKSRKIRRYGKCQRRDLNPRPRAYESPALPLSYSGKILGYKYVRNIEFHLLLTECYSLFYINGVQRQGTS